MASCESDRAISQQFRDGSERPRRHRLRTEQRRRGRPLPADGSWVMERNWNGDQVDSDLNFTAKTVVLKLRLGRY